MPKNADEKRLKILETAKRRFAHYGMAKTTMAEIAKDLSFSKALLYYYFPDKNSLYAAVLEHVMEELEEDITNSLKSIVSVSESIVIVLEKRMEFVKKYYYILEYTVLMRKDLSSELDQLLIDSFESQKEIIRSVFRQGVERGELMDVDLEEISKIFLFSSMGMRLVVVKDLKSSFIPDKEEFDAILAMQKKMATIFIRGLKA
ncbi:TetR/AcrR family transcriptional regulator [Sphingobacterium tabacisoli]|uniref:TetR/AcrR family transcriptional regulator n=1 Tax=Sphingobacterium tabacisoli TaxID=2044855 RepID=A0ABW5L925_9SPHI|nr:TetR/AcrR family transcriptional regulator [Sphingobacterium tabacisoli]